MPRSGCHADSGNAVPLWLLGHPSEHSHSLTRCEGEQITPASREDGLRE